MLLKLFWTFQDAGMSSWLYHFKQKEKLSPLAIFIMQEGVRITRDLCLSTRNRPRTYLLVLPGQKLISKKQMLEELKKRMLFDLSLIHISEPTRLGMTSYAVFCLK